jgi:ABC-2 type transport system ATP-binding protein
VTPLLRVDKLGKQYRSRWALRDASFEVRAGEILGLIGPNGSGKTTLFACLAGAQPATLGAVEHAGRPLPAIDRKQAMFFVPDGIRPWPDQDVSWALTFVAGMFGSSTASRDAVVSELALTPFLPARLGTLSKGEHKRVMLALGLLTSQPVLMLDEPFDGLDLRQTRDVMHVLRAHAERGRTLFLSVHQLGDAARVCDRLLLLSGGRIAGEGTLEELRARAQLANGGLEEVFLALT